MKYILIFLIIGFFSLQPYFSTAQGCSDAGFCSLNDLKPHSDSQGFTVVNIGSDNMRPIAMPAMNQLKAGISLGSNEHPLLGIYLDYSRQINDQFSVNGKLTATYQNGKGLDIIDLSDIYLSAGYRPLPQLDVTLGVKIPLANGNKLIGGIPLPMEYQPSLGTFDLIVGIGYEVKNFQFTLALQQPLIQNHNMFDPEKYPTDSPFRQFSSTYRYKRSGDILFRVSYPFGLFKKKLFITPSILPIFHLTNDQFTDNSNIEREIIGSQGITLNGALFLDYIISAKHALQLNVGTPFLFRKTRPDGLTRHYVITLEYRIRF